MAVSFLGWLVETVFFFVCYGELWDRGFMTLPFCTIYGCSFFLLYALLEWIDRKTGRAVPGDWRRMAMVFLLSALVPAGLELATGWFFHRALGMRLWSYTEYRFHFRGYVCLEYTLLWGVLLPGCMRHGFLPLKDRVFAMPDQWVCPLASLLGMLALTDWVVNFSEVLGLLPAG